MQSQANSIKGVWARPRGLSVSVRAVLRGSAVAAGAAAGIALLARGLWTVVGHGLSDLAGPGPQAPDTLLTVAVAGVALGLLVWFVLGVALEALATVPGAVGTQARRAADRLTPALATKLAVFVIGSAVGGAALSSTAAADAPGGLAGSGVVATAPDPGFAPAPDRLAYGALPAGSAAPAGSFSKAEAPDPGFVPARPRVRPVQSPSVLTHGGVAAPAGTVVHRGDTLWAIAARELGPDATDAEVAERWPHWYAANRAVIGSDPDRILPGQVLVAPQVGAAR